MKYSGRHIFPDTMYDDDKPETVEM